LDFADDVAILTEMLDVLVLGLTVTQEEVTVFDLQINWQVADGQLKSSIHLSASEA